MKAWVGIWREQTEREQHRSTTEPGREAWQQNADKLPRKGDDKGQKRLTHTHRQERED